MRRWDGSGAGWTAFFVICLISLGFLSSVAAQQPGPAVPAPLDPWVPWVLHDHPDRVCAQLRPGDHRCAWPGELLVEVEDRQGRFKQVVWLDRPQEVRLPGNGELWPQQVKADAGPVVVGKGTDGMPMASLGAGLHVVTGVFEWSRPPELIAVAPDTGRVTLTLRGAPVTHPRLDAEGRLWLQGGGDEAGATEADNLRVAVFRRVLDGVPIKIVNRLELNVSGRARELSLGTILLPDSRAVAVRGGLPLQISPDGSVQVYVRPGSHQVEIDTLLTAPVESLKAPKHEHEGFEAQEVWVWVPDPRQRAVEISGLTAVDPERTALPSDWRDGSTFLVEPGDALALKETRRGQVEAPPNTLRVYRTMWLDLDGEGYTVRDQLSGQLHQGWRLNHADSGTLGRVTQRSEQADLLITTDPESKLSGVELRTSQVDLQAELRLEQSRGQLDVVGWDHDVQQLGAELHLPPGWDLIGGRGVDQMRGTWLESWTLFDFFFLLMITLSLGKLCGWKWAPLAALALCLSQGHADAPRWVWIHLLATLALIRVLPEGWFRRAALAYRAAALLALVVILAPYARDQVRFALHPQVDRGAVAATDGWGNTRGEPAFMPQGTTETLKQEMMEQDFDQRAFDDEAGGMPQKRVQARSKGDAIDLLSSSDASQNWVAKEGKLGRKLQQIDPNAVVQTGPGLPNWSWRQWQLEWTGPVNKDHEVDLWLLSPTWNRILSLLRVALLILMALLLVARRDMRWIKPEADKRAAAGLGAALVVLLTLGLATSAQAQTPSQEHLDLLRARLLEPYQCEGACVVVSDAEINVDEQALSLRAEVHVQRDSAWFLPGPSGLLQIRQVRLDGVETHQLRREPGGLTAVRLPAGLHVVEVEGTLVDRDVVTLNLDAATRPQRVRFKSRQWSVDGINEAGVPDNSLQLTRLQREGQDDGAELSAELPPWYRLERNLALGLPWQLQTEVVRDNAERPQLIKIPLVPGEQVITEGVRVEKGLALVNFPRGATTVTYLSELPIAPALSLKAATDQPWTETWTVACSRIWRCDFEGLPPVHSVNDSGTFAPLWRPWPGESLEIAINRPEGTPGQATTVDEVIYEVTPGKRLLEARLTMSVRASQGGWQKVTLPPEARLQSVSIDGQTHNIAPRDGAVSLPVKPGAQRLEVVWQQPWERALHEVTPTVHIGSRAVNATIRLNLGEDRWLLWVTGPQWGPAILFWSHLIILLILGAVLGQIKQLPLKTWEWLLLAIGMGQLPVVAMLPAVAWFAALAWRKQSPQERWWLFDLFQLVLVGMTLVALVSLYAAIHTNLLFNVDMQVRGAGSSEMMLQWYVDQVDGQLPQAGIISAPLLVWRVIMLLWALWLVTWLLKWVPWGWRAFSAEGLWKMPARPPAPEPTEPGGGSTGGGAPPSSETSADAPATNPASPTADAASGSAPTSDPTMASSDASSGGSDPSGDEVPSDESPSDSGDFEAPPEDGEGGEQAPRS